AKSRNRAACLILPTLPDIWTDVPYHARTARTSEAKGSIPCCGADHFPLGQRGGIPRDALVHQRLLGDLFEDRPGDPTAEMLPFRIRYRRQDDESRVVRRGHPDER